MNPLASAVPPPMMPPSRAADADTTAARKNQGGTVAQERSFAASAVTLNDLDDDSPRPEPLVMLHGGARRCQA